MESLRIVAIISIWLEMINLSLVTFVCALAWV